MAFLEVPTRNDLPAYRYTIPLEGKNYQLDFTFNERMGKWFCEISDDVGNPIIAPVPVVADWGIFKRFKVPTLPPGQLFAFDTAGTSTDPGRFDLGDRVRMIYQESA